MDQINHREFIAENALNIESFPEALIKKINLFDKLLDKLKDTTGDDTQLLKDKLVALDDELMEDLETQFEDQLDNNELAEENDDVLEKLFKKNSKREYLKSELIAAGFKGELSENFIVTGEYCLQRTGTFSFRFKIYKSYKK